MPLTVHEYRSGKVIARWIGITLCVIILLVIAVTIFLMRHKLLENKLIPPNPEVRQPPSPSKLRVFGKAAVCTDGPPCSIIGQDILKQGGSAMDAAIAALFCNGIVSSQSMGLGGGFMMVTYDRETRKVDSLIAREKAPSAAHRDMYSEAHEKGSSRTGGLAIGVPGELLGYFEAWKRYGRLDWIELIKPSVKLCRFGYNLTKHQYDSLTFRKSVIHNDPNLRELFIDPETNTYRRVGSTIKHTTLCDTLEKIGFEGGEVLNNGSLTKVLVEDIQNVGGIITEQDLNEYRPEWGEPVSVTLHGGERVYSVPPPGSGSLLTYILSVLDGYNITAPQDQDNYSDEILTLHRMIESFKFAFAQRTELSDPNFVDTTQVVRKLTSREFADDTRRKINDSRTYDDPQHYGAVFYTNDGHGTAHISVLSPDGDAVSVTSTINLYFGAGVTSARTGIILNSVMDDFSIPDADNYFSLPPSPNNFITPNKRPLSSASPTIILDPDDDVRLVIGASGGTKIPTAIAWVIIRHLWFGEDIKEAVDASRVHHQLTPMEISYEYGVLQQIIEGLERIGHKTHRYRERGSIVCAVSRKGGKVYANADFRKGGDVYGLD